MPVSSFFLLFPLLLLPLSRPLSLSLSRISYLSDGSTLPDCLLAVTATPNLTNFAALTFRLLAAALCFSPHRSQRRNLQPHPLLVQRQQAHDSVESSSPTHAGTQHLSSAYVLVPSMCLSAISADIIVFSAGI